MRIRTRKNLKKKNAIISVLFLLPLISFGICAGLCFYIIDDLASFTLRLDPPNTDYFYELDEITGNLNYLERMAYIYNRQMEKFHMPTNISVDVTFTNNSFFLTFFVDK